LFCGTFFEPPGILDMPSMLSGGGTGGQVGAIAPGRWRRGGAAAAP